MPFVLQSEFRETCFLQYRPFAVDIMMTLLFIVYAKGKHVFHTKPVGILSCCSVSVMFSFSVNIFL